MVEEESDDVEAVVKLLELNDSINTTIQRYNLVQKGDIDAARAIPPVSSASATSLASKPSSSTPVEDSLIDLGGDLNGQSAPAASASNSKSLQDDLLGLSIDDPNGSIGPGGGIALGFGANTSKLSEGCRLPEMGKLSACRYPRATSTLFYASRRQCQHRGPAEFTPIVITIATAGSKLCGFRWIV